MWSCLTCQPCYRSLQDLEREIKTIKLYDHFQDIRSKNKVTTCSIFASLICHFLKKVRPGEKKTQFNSWERGEKGKKKSPLVSPLDRDGNTTFFFWLGGGGVSALPRKIGRENNFPGLENKSKSFPLFCT